MKKLAAMMLCGMLLFSNTVTPQAATVTEVVTELSGLVGVDTSNLVAYLQTIQITQSQKKQIDGYVNQAKGIINGVSNLSDLEDTQRTELMSIAKQAGAIVGLTVEIAKVGDMALTTATISANGKVLMSVNSQDVKDVTSNINESLGKIEEVVEDLFESNVITVVPDKTPDNGNNNNNNNNNNDNNFQPYPGELKPTGLTASAFGLSGLVLAGAGVALTRKSSK